MSDTVALWYYRYGRPAYSLYETEAEAARGAIYLEDSESGAVTGVQFADGRLLSNTSGKWQVTCEWWPEADRQEKLIEVQQREYASQRAAEPKRPTRQIKYPFDDGVTLRVDADEPGWLGGVT